MAANKGNGLHLRISDEIETTNDTKSHIERSLVQNQMPVVNNELKSTAEHNLLNGFSKRDKRIKILIPVLDKVLNFLKLDHVLTGFCL
jgi:hypothetical protein